MKKNIALVLFVVLLMSEMLGLKPAFSLGFSAKNIFLYTSILLIMIHQAVASKDARVESIKFFHIIFILLIIYAFFSWQLTNVQLPLAEYQDKASRLAAFKGFLVDHYFFFLVFYYAISTLDEGVALAKTLLILTFITTVITVIDVYNVPDLGIIKQMENVSAANLGRVQGPLGEPNQYAAFLVLFLPAYIALAMSGYGMGWAKKVFYYGAALSTFAVLLLTGSRGGVVGLFIGCIVGFFVFKKYIDTRKLIATLAKVVLAGVLVISAILVKHSDLIMSRLAAVTKSTDAVSASAGRLWIWEQGFKIMMEHPKSFLVGMGWDTFAGYVGIVSHNTFLNVFFDLGVMGFILYLLLIVWIFSKLKSSAINASGQVQMILGGALFGYSAMLCAVFFVNLFTPWYFVWAYLGVMLRIAMLSRSEVPADVNVKKAREVPKQLMV